MNRITILTILMISILSCKEEIGKTEIKSYKANISGITINNFDSISNFKILSKLDKQVLNKETNHSTYKTLDSIKKHLDGADAEYYIEIYKNAILFDTEAFKVYHKNNNAPIDYDVISFFSQDIDIIFQICLNISDLIQNYFDVAKIEDKDGFVNLRVKRNSKSKIITKIESGKTVEILNADEDWWLVLTDDKVGYIHKSRLKLIK